VAMAPYSRRTGLLVEDREWLQTVHDHREAVDPAVLPGLLFALSGAAADQGDYATAQQTLEEHLALLADRADPTAQAGAIVALGHLASHRGRYAEADDLYRRAKRFAQSADDKQAELVADMSRGRLLGVHLNDERGAEATLRKALSYTRAIGDREHEAYCVVNLGEVALKYGRIDEALRLFEEGGALSARLGDRWLETSTRLWLGEVHRRSGRAEAARESLREAIAEYRAMGERAGVVECLEQLAILEADHDPTTTALLMGAASSLRQTVSVGYRPRDDEGCRLALSRARDNLGDGALQLFEAGAALTMEQAVSAAIG
jgi:tetratricopeptide (TPR) repeat protein